MKKSTMKTIKFRRFAPLEDTKGKFYPYNPDKDPVVDILREKAEEISGGMAATQDYYARKFLESAYPGLSYTGIAQKVYKRSWLRHGWIELKYKIYQWRIRLAEWIGGEDLHSNCGDY